MVAIVSEPRAVATGSSSFAELLDPIATAPGSDTSFDTLSVATGSRTDFGSGKHFRIDGIGRGAGRYRSRF